MKVGIFYFTLDPRDGEYSAVSLEGKISPSGGDVIAGYVRVVAVEASDLESAQDLATPREGEVVMNTHEIL